MRSVMGVVAAFWISHLCLGPAYGFGDEIWRSAEVGIWLRERQALACHTRAQQVIDIHRAHKVGLEPSSVFDPTLQSRALVGLWVEVRGPEFVRKDLELGISLRFRSIEKTYRGVWREEGTSDGVVAKRTDWWINLERLFSPREIESLCSEPHDLRVTVIAPRFIKR